MPILGVIASGISGHLTLSPPYLAYESIATVTGSTPATIDFTAIPGTFRHLQIRFISRDTRASTINSLQMQVNADTGSNYSYHNIQSSGSGAPTGDGAGSSTSTDYMVNASANATASIFGAGIVDIFDYSSTTKTKTFKMINAVDLGGSGRINLTSAGWFNSTDPITSIKFKASGTITFDAYSHFALYGIK